MNCVGLKKFMLANKKQLRKTFIYLSVSLVFQSPVLKAATDDLDDVQLSPLIHEPAEEKLDTWQKIRQKTRFKFFTEFMTPAFQPTQFSVPSPQGGEALPANFFTIFSLDYEIAPHYRIGYWQRVINPVATNENVQHLSVYPRNPRFSIRRTEVIDDPNVRSTFDLYIQPGLAPEANIMGRKFEVGFRTNTNYSIPNSKWEIGEVTEVNYEIVHDPLLYGTTYGWAGIWANYRLNNTFSTQSYATVNFAHEIDEPTISLQLDLPRPYLQNGIGISISESVWMAILINNHLERLPTWRNSWASIWVAIDFL